MLLEVCVHARKTSDRSRPVLTITVIRVEVVRAVSACNDARFLSERFLIIALFIDLTIILVLIEYRVSWGSLVAQFHH